jgi:hypothetical protein
MSVISPGAKPDVAGQVSFTSQLMQNYRMAAPVTAGSEIAIAHDLLGRPEFFSIGASGRVYDIGPSTVSDTGWQCTDLAFPGQAKALAAASEVNGSITVYAADTDNVVWSITNKRWGAGWQKLPPVPLTPADASVQGLRVGYGVQGDPFLVALFRWNTPYIRFYNLFEGQWVAYGYQPPQVFDFCASRVAHVGSARDGYSTCSGVYAACPDIKEIGDRGVTGMAYNYGSSDYYGRLSLGRYAAVSAALDANGDSQPFALDLGDHGVYLLYPPPDGGENFARKKVSGELAVTALAAASTSGGNLEVFMLGTGGNLHHVRQVNPGTQEFGPVVPLTTGSAFRRLVAGRNPEGYTDVFAVTAEGDVYHIWQDPTTTDWHIDEVELSERGHLEEYSSYNVQCTTHDASGAASPGAAVRIFSESPVEVEVNGASVLIDRDHPWEGVSNAAGLVTIGMKIAALGLPPLAVWAAGMPEQDRVEVDPSGPVRDRLSTLDKDGADLRAAKVTVGRGGQQMPLLTSGHEASAGAVSQAVTRAMSLTGTSKVTGIHSGTLHHGNDPRVARYLTASETAQIGRINRTAVPEQHWQIDFTGATATFEDLTYEQAGELLASRGDMADATDFFGFDVSWGDVFDAVVDGIATVAHIVVSTVTDGIHTAIDLVINGVKYAFGATIELVSQAVDLVQEIFSTVAAGFSQLFGWLGWIFDWDDILRTHQAVTYLIDQTFDFQRSALPELKSTIGDFFSSLERTVNHVFDEAIGGVIGHDSLIKIQSQAAEDRPAGIDIAQHNVVFNSTVNNLGVSSPGATLLTASPEALTAASNVVSQLTEQADSFEGDKAFTDALTYFKAALADPDAFVASALAGLLSAARGISLWALESASNIIDSLIDELVALLGTIRDLLFAPWDIPLVSDLYAWLTTSADNPKGETLSAASLAALLTAVPGTSFYKIAYPNDQFPFDTAQHVEEFKSTYSASNLLKSAGFNSAKTSISGDIAVASVPLGVQRLFNLLSAFNTIGFGIAEATLDNQPPWLNPKEKNGENTENAPAPKALSVLSYLTLGVEYAGQVLSIPVLTGNSSMAFSCEAGDRFDALVWYLQWIEVLADSVYFCFSKVITRVYGDSGAIVASAWGATHCGLLLTSALRKKPIDGMEVTESLCIAIPEMLKFARVGAIYLATKESSLIVLPVVDALGGFVAGVLHIVRSMGPSEPVPQQGSAQQPPNKVTVAGSRTRPGPIG